jgi:two-component system cell cycle response regulator DivK
MSTRTILIVDDHPEIRERLRVMLQAVGWDVKTACNGRDALESVHTARPHAIVLDMVMPGMDGFEVARSLKSDPDYRHIPILAATGLASRADRERCLAAGCDAYMAKPFTIEQLQQRLSMLTGD